MKDQRNEDKGKRENGGLKEFAQRQYYSETKERKGGNGRKLHSKEECVVK